MKGVAEKLTDAPEQIPVVEAVMLIAGVDKGLTVTGMLLEVMVAGDGQTALLVIRQVTTSLSARVLLENTAVFAAAFTPLTCH